MQEHQASLPGQIHNFVVHLRLHYQFLVLSGPFLLAALYIEYPDWETFILQFLNVHVLLFGGATAYNSWWDKDEGPVGGIKHPPKMKEWMHPVSLLMQFTGFGFTLHLGWTYQALYAFSLLLFWLYSTPLARWKGRPLLSLAVIGLSTGANSFLMGYIAAGVPPDSLYPFLAALGAALVLLSLYPVSQIFQIESDTKRGDRTFASRFGIKGVVRFYIASFLTGSVLITVTLFRHHPTPALLFGGVSLGAFFIILYLLKTLSGEEHEYEMVMKLKFIASLSIVCFIVFSLLMKHDIICGIDWLKSMFEHQN